MKNDALDGPRAGGMGAGGAGDQGSRGHQRSRGLKARAQVPLLVFLVLSMLAETLAGRSADAANYVVAVGNNSGLKDEVRLRFAEADARSVASLLRALGRVEPDNEVVMLGDDAPKLRTVLLRMNARIRATQGESPPNDALIVYYSGHADVRGLHLGTSIMAFDELKTIVESSPARVRILIVDSCRAGGMTKIKGVGPAPSFSVQWADVLGTQGVAIITSSSGSEDSQESETLKGSFFTHHLMNGLRGAADRDHDDHVTLGEAYSYAYKETIRSTGRTMNLQHPTYLYDMKGKGDFVVTYLLDGREKTGRLTIDDPGRYLLFEGGSEGRLVAEVFLEERQTTLTLAPGRYFVQRRADDSFREYEASVLAGATVALSRCRYKDVTYARLLRKGGGGRPVHALLLMASSRGPVLDGESFAPGLIVGYGLDFSWITVSMLGRFGTSTVESVGDRLTATHREFALRWKVERFIDLDYVSLSLGLVFEGVHHQETFESRGDAPSRSTWGAAFGGAVAAEVAVSGPLVLRAEFGPLTEVFGLAIVENGIARGERMATPFTWAGAMGLAWRL